jgi:voltage-gated potassium channel
MIGLIIVSIIPLAFHYETQLFSVIDVITTYAFIFDYVARWMTADMGTQKKYPFASYPFQPMSIIDLISILPSVTALSEGFRLLKIFRLMRTLRVFRAFKLVRYSKNIKIIIDVFKAQRDSMITVLVLAVAYILISALVIFNVEPDSFGNFFDAVYWATVSLTTMGYGDIYPVTTVGRIVTMASSLFGIAIVALPAGIVTAGYMEEIQKAKKE